jgi:Tubulin like
MAAELENHLIIGLGGTGGSILRSFRKMIYQRFRTTEPSNVNLRYLYVDSETALMKQDDPTWKTLGTSVQLPEASLLRIAGLNLNSVIDQINDYPGIAKWIGSRNQLRDVLSSTAGAEIVGGQKRRLGRFLFACKAKEFRERIQLAVRDMTMGNVADVTFHFCCGLAGGTGSGSLIDALCQTRATFPAKTYRTLVYALLPERFPKPIRLGPNYHANGYAALLELNALDVGKYRPWDVTWNVKGRFDLQDPYWCCYLFSDENEDHNKFDVEKHLPDIAASFLFQKIVAARDVAWTNGDSIKRQERFEVGVQAIQKELAPGTGDPERTRRFFSFGTKQIVYPEQEIKEYLTYVYAQQAALQLQYNNWSDTVGYQDEPPNQALSEFVRTPETAQNWQISDEHLLLSVGILADEKANKRWRPIPAYWIGVMPNFKTAVLEANANKSAVWLDELAKMCAEAYDRNYRDLGVRRFYEVKQRDIPDHAAEIRKVIEAGLYRDWTDGVRSMHDIDRLLAALLHLLEEKADHFEELGVRAAQQVQTAEARVTSNLNQWAKTGLISSLLGSRRRLFDDQAQALQDLYMYRTLVVAATFAKGLVQALTAEITALANEVNAAKGMISSVMEDFRKAIQSRLSDAGEDDVNQQIIRFYNPAAVKAVARSMILDEERQRLQTSVVRTAITQLLGENPSFWTFNQRLSQQALNDVLQTTCQRTSTEAHDALVASRKIPEGVLKVRIIDRLAKQYGTNREALRAYIASVVSRAKTFLVFDESQALASSGDANDSIQDMYSHSTIILPKADDQAEFRQMLEDEFRDAASGDKDIVTNTERTNEITLINVKSAFPARFVADLRFLKEKYDARVGGANGAQAVFELHTDDPAGFPSLYPRVVGPAEVLPYLLLASALGIARTLKDPVTGREATYLETTDDRGREAEPIKLGDTLASAVDELGTAEFYVLEKRVQALLAGAYLHADKRTELLASVEALVEAVKAERPDVLDRTRQAYIKAQRAVEDLLGKIPVA